MNPPVNQVADSNEPAKKFTIISMLKILQFKDHLRHKTPYSPVVDPGQHPGGGANIRCWQIFPKIA